MDGHPTLTWIGHSLSVGAIVGALAGILPVVGALVALVWYTIQIHESKTYQDWRRRRHLGHIAYLQAKLERLIKSTPPQP